MADKHGLEHAEQALQDSRTARQIAAASLHARKAELESSITRMGQSTPQRRLMQEEIGDLNQVLGLLTKQRGEDQLGALDSA